MAPYLNIKLLNVAQAIIAIFLASDFLKRDKKLDSTEIIYIRSMTNAVYVIGKSLAILILFLGLNVVLLFAGFIIHFFFSVTLFALVPYFLYPLLISLPTLIFTIGLTFFVMSLIRNQAVTFIVLLGYAGVTLFFLHNKFYG